MKIASEKQQRILSRELISVDIATEVAPFTFKLKQGGEGVKPNAMAYLPYLPDKIFELLEQHSRYVTTTEKQQQSLPLLILAMET